MTTSEDAAIGRINLGCISDIFTNAPGRVEQPVVQCVQVRPMQSKEGSAVERYRVVVSDTQSYVQTILATAINDEVHSNRLRRGVLCKLLSYSTNFVKQKRILIITGIQVLTDYGEHETLGKPEPLLVPEEGKNPETMQAGGFYGNQQPQNQQQNKPIPSHTKAPSSSSNANIYPIEALSPYSHKWTIRARCTHKGDIKTWHNQRGDGKLFSVNLLDDSGEIRATGFNDQCTQLYDLFQEGSVYYISAPCRVQLAKKQFSNLNNDYELTFERETVVEKAEDQSAVPQVRFNFTTIADLQSIEKDTTVDVVGVLKDVNEVSQITSKTTSKPYDKRELTLCDDTGYEVRMTIWGKTATSFDVTPASVVAFKGVKVSDFGGRSLSLLSSGSMAVNPDIAESHRLRGWYDHQGSSANFATHANVQGTVQPGEKRQNQTKTVSQVVEEQLGFNDQPDYFNLRATIHFVKQQTYAYPACANDGCNKKVTQLDTTGEWRCEACETNHARPEWRYILGVNVADHTGSISLNCFDEVAKQLMGKPANDVKAVEEEEGEGSKKMSAIFTDANFRMYNWRCRAKMDTYQEQQRVRYQVMSATPIDFVSEGQKMAALIKQYEGMGV